MRDIVLNLPLPLPFALRCRPRPMPPPEDESKKGEEARVGGAECGGKVSLAFRDGDRDGTGDLARESDVAD